MDYDKKFSLIKDRFLEHPHVGEIAWGLMNGSLSQKEATECFVRVYSEIKETLERDLNSQKGEYFKD